jgi:hypothetical protein
MAAYEIIRTRRFTDKGRGEQNVDTIALRTRTVQSQPPGSCELEGRKKVDGIHN